MCKRNGISPTTILNTLAGYVGGSYSSNLNRFTKLYRVMVQAAPEYRLDTEALNNIFVRNGNGEMSPISQYLTLTRVYGSESLSRFNLFSAISVSGIPADGYSSGQALKAIEEVAKTAPDDLHDDDFRYAAADVRPRSGCQRKHIGRRGHGGRNALRHGGIALRSAIAVHHFPVYGGALDATKERYGRRQ